ncbi:hypothetical protein SASPL_107349 [Salvia splendens]|uniref:Uncharacterized protein n=1 Tax=Salvia splendens TaxID=180675 RepID=A0A8X8YGA1_SALSN|nr:uncharacterized protein LOC121796446 [Salvia splendens]KAG6429301.1 hypothetical protein SASPL_107349 [Salvia splendens]
MRLLNLIWLPANILNSAASSLTSPWISHGHTSGKSPRRRPLHTCGASCVVIARKASAKAQDLDAPLGPMAKKSISIFNTFCPSFVHSAAHRCLGLLIVIDDQILTIEGKIEAIIPRSAAVFDGIDGVVRGAEALPELLDEAVRKSVVVIRQLPLVDWAVARLISWLSFVLSVLVGIGCGEKEISIDENCKSEEQTKSVQFEKGYSYADTARKVQEDEIGGVPREVIHLSVKRMHSWKSRIKALEEPLSAGDSPMYSSYQSANTSPVSDCSQEDNHAFNQTLGCSYKDDQMETEEEHVHLKDIPPIQSN